MTRFIQRINVLANPYFILDHKGRPCCAFPAEPASNGAHRGFIGAEIDSVRTRVQTRNDAGTVKVRASRQDTVFKFSGEVVSVRASAYYLDALKSGAILPGDAQCAQWAGVKFVDTPDALRDAKGAAESDFDTQYGDGSIAALREEHAAEERVRDAEVAKASVIDAATKIGGSNRASRKDKS